MSIIQIQLRNDTAANWTAANPTLLSGEIGIETDTGKFKIGTGSTSWNSLAYNIALPTQTSQSGKFLTTDGTTASWSLISQVPSQTGNSGKYLTTDGTTASWAAVTTDPTQDIFMMMGV